MNRYDPFWQQRELERLLAQTRPTFDILNTLPRSFFDSMHQFEELSRKFSLPPSFLTVSDEIIRAMDSSNLYSSLPAFSQVDHGVLRTFESLQQQMSSAFAAVKGIGSTLDSISKAMADSLVGSEALIGGLEFRPMDMAVLTRAHDSFEKFALGRLSISNTASDIFRANTLSAIAEVAQFLPDLAYTSELSVLMAAPVVAKLQGLPRMNVFEEIDLELEWQDFQVPDLDIAGAVEGSSASKMLEVGGRLVRLVYEINVAAERSGEGNIFKPTTTTMYAFHVVPTTVASEESRFLEVVDALFFLLYEGSGDGSRLTSKINGQRLGALWLLKYLRLGARHDLDHGTDSGAKKN